MMPLPPINLSTSALQRTRILPRRKMESPDVTGRTRNPKQEQIHIESAHGGLK